MTYRHITNLRSPFDNHDQALLHVTQDYRLGDPIEADPSETEIPPLSAKELKSQGIVGLYAPLDRIETEDFLKFTGWNVNTKWWEARKELV